MNLISKIPIVSNAAVTLASVVQLTVTTVGFTLGVITDVQVEEIHVKVDVGVTNAGQGKLAAGAVIIEEEDEPCH